MLLVFYRYSHNHLFSWQCNFLLLLLPPPPLLFLMISPTTSSLVSGAPTLDSVSPVTSIKLFLTKESTPSLMTKSLKKGMKSHLRFSKSIEDSRIAIIVFSKEYASSSFYLDELVHIIHFSNEKGSTIIPVFYGTEPSHVRKLNGSYGEALAKHEEQFQNSKENMERLLKWKKALNQAANLSGHHFNLGYPSLFISCFTPPPSPICFLFLNHIVKN
ncbi:putative TIR domain-containing protein [Medicago truncatula]|uniref:Putative TIR domain-containing protein n=1 Tax=Medicago truncatula TaxID=3880 RepID=A0A396HID6_MEDTR|nr:putative TIR domain-containing protein [Medicago truncatula]